MAHYDSPKPLEEMHLHLDPAEANFLRQLLEASIRDSEKNALKA